MILFNKGNVRYLPVSFKEKKNISARTTYIEISKQSKFLLSAIIMLFISNHNCSSYKSDCKMLVSDEVFNRDYRETLILDE